MKATIYAKKKTTGEGKTFYSYITKLTKKDGSEITASVKFRDECGAPKPDDCPCNIIVDKADANLATSHFTREDTGEEATSYTLWVKNWKEGEVYKDNSLDDFAD